MKSGDGSLTLTCIAAAFSHLCCLLLTAPIYELHVIGSDGKFGTVRVRVTGQIVLQSPAKEYVVDGLRTMKMMTGQQPSVQQGYQWRCQDDSTPFSV